ncbi:2-amino-4-hydroxy-6-hydroxymethyldihydropteridine diphosphokinase [Lysobacter sp. GX 14042]|uniref:2-amino-4-hydroxy-6- hydroxymethyldihydropteridine diphosphokinase n=1 Tax=Lysobacter sp. GX 14042 TaxID=2907155 RepID=UPI001F44ACC3|nr:2-amino-4-hydroxy-6-hydroxymethyldihydropteridine diphosphokinase [Lysobacter sp. GX 14042]MCE7032649.1 2-amino-4-hydroxy-6-hydroxymethyldihydropteridine diphosphokinase [Lysobacter sp. GX 14042]
MSTTVEAVVGLGSNQGDSVLLLRDALASLDALAHTRIVRASRYYRTPAWGVEDQPDFVNAAALLQTRLEPPELLAAMLEIERGAGRTRRADGGDRWGPRTLDLDLLLHGGRITALPGLSVPHPHLHLRAFALVPLLEVAPDALIPGIGPARDRLAGLATGAIEALPYAPYPADPHPP